MIDHDEARRALQERQATLREELSAGSSATKTVKLDQSRVGRLSRMDALQAQAMANASARHRDHELRRIAAALRRLDDGEYGDCDECGEAIARARLLVDPAASLCVACAEIQESS